MESSSNTPFLTHLGAIRLNLMGGSGFLIGGLGPGGWATSLGR